MFSGQMRQNWSFLARHRSSMFTDGEKKQAFRKQKTCETGCFGASGTGCLESMQGSMKSQHNQNVLEWNVLQSVRNIYIYIKPESLRAHSTKGMREWEEWEPILQEVWLPSGQNLRKWCSPPLYTSFVPSKAAQTSLAKCLLLTQCLVPFISGNWGFMHNRRHFLTLKKKKKCS